MPWIKGGKVVYSGLEAGEMVCMSSDSEGDDVDLAEELLNLDLDSDLEGKMEIYKIMSTILRVTKKKWTNLLLLRKVRTQVCLSPNKNA